MDEMNRNRKIMKTFNPNSVNTQKSIKLLLLHLIFFLFCCSRSMWAISNWTRYSTVNTSLINSLFTWPNHTKIGNWKLNALESFNTFSPIFLLPLEELRYGFELWFIAWANLYSSLPERKASISISNFSHSCL